MTVTDEHRAEREQMQAWDARFEAALALAAETVPGLNCHTTREQPHLGMPRLFWDGDTRGAYWVRAGLISTGSPATTLTKASAVLHYLRDPAGDGPFERDENPLDTLDAGTTDPHLVAALIVTAAQHHRTSL
ncbi:hypothetical protein [Streptacidiphilus sp. EB103A]|uniref:hypothetical protein n=1 Tax=Streptacidiphilus sp. EB103A TaxID=3156275 RepID=UPI0035133524